MRWGEGALALLLIIAIAGWIDTTNEAQRNIVYLVTTAHDNNITLSPEYDELIKQIKIKRYTKSIQREVR